MKIAFIDSGRPDGHPDFPIYGLNVNCSGTSPNYDIVGHGTAVAGVAVALDNGAHLVGVSPSATPVMLKVTPLTYDALECAMTWAYNSGAWVINLSLGGAPNATVTDFIKSAYYWHGKVIVASAGNTGSNPVCGGVCWPASLPEVIAVTATDANNQRWSGAWTGPEIELSAPGVNVHTLWPGYLALPAVGCATLSSSYVASCTGTSFAAPHVAGAAAILRAFNPNWSNVVVRERLQLSATRLGPANEYGYGLLDVRAALDYVHELPPHDPAYAASISGPPEISPTATCTWVAGISQGGSVPPYTYQWLRNGNFVSMQDHYIGGMDGAQSFQLILNVTSSNQLVAADTMTVANTGFGECFMMD